jgi:hypothetical protein
VIITFSDFLRYSPLKTHRFRMLCRRAGYTPGTNPTIPLSFLLQLLHAEWLQGHDELVEFVAEILPVLAPSFDAFADELAPTLDTGVASPTFLVSYLDARYVGCSGRTMLFDTREGTDVSELDSPAVTILTCDITALYHAYIRCLETSGFFRQEPADA